MKKIEILKKINELLMEEVGFPGKTVTTKNQKQSKKDTDAYYSEVEKKYKKYTKIEDAKSEGDKGGKFMPKKRNVEDSEREFYGGSGMEGLRFDDDGTEVNKEFVKRIDDLNKVEDENSQKVYDDLKKKGAAYRSAEAKFEKTSPVATKSVDKDFSIKSKNSVVTKVEKPGDKKTIKKLTYKKPFVSESAAIKLIPNEFKTDLNMFEMTDGNKSYKIRWEGDKDNGSAVILIAKDDKLISEEMSRMFEMMDYSPSDKVSKTDLITETENFNEYFTKKKIYENEEKSKIWDSEVISEEETVDVKPGSNSVTTKDGIEFMYDTTNNKVNAMKSGKLYNVSVYVGDQFKILDPEFFKVHGEYAIKLHMAHNVPYNAIVNGLKKTYGVNINNVLTNNSFLNYFWERNPNPDPTQK